MLKEAVRILENNGAPRVRAWATVDEIDPHLGEWETSVLLYALKNKPEFRDRFIHECLPIQCKRLTVSTAEVANYTIGWIPEVHQKITSSEVGDVIKKAWTWSDITPCQKIQAMLCIECQELQGMLCMA